MNKFSNIEDSYNTGAKTCKSSMTQLTKITVVGPSRGGKTGLIIAMNMAAGQNRNSHGYPANLQFAIDQESARKSGDIPFETLAGNQLQRADFVLQFNGKYKNTTRDASIARAYRFQRLVHGTSQIEGRNVEIIDTGGEMSGLNFWQEISQLREIDDTAMGDDAQERIKRAEVFTRHIAESNAIIMVLPIMGHEVGPDIDQMEELLTNAINAKDSRIERIVVAWSQVDLLLGLYGSNAARIAHHPSLMEEVNRTVLDQHVILADMLDRIAHPASADLRKIGIHHIAVSSHGFLWDSGTANSVFLSDPDNYAHPDPGGFKQYVAERYWQPYLAADPYLIAVFGPEGNRFCFDHTRLRPGYVLEQSKPENAAPDEPVSKEKKPSLLSRVLKRRS